MSNSHHGTHPSHPAHPQQAAATPATPAAPPYKPLAFSFPFVPAGKDDPADPMTYMKALGNAQNGFYPLGANGLWHGGIHFDGKTGNALKQDVGVRAIADGDVVAYRLDHQYPELEYKDKRSALYSTGFVLIRHKLQMPPPQPKQDAASSTAASAPGAASSTPAAPASAASTASAPAAASTPAAPAQPPQAPAADTLVFFSLYMHLLDWVGYELAIEAGKEAPTDPNAPKIQPMPFWEGDRYYRVGAKAKDKQDVPKPKALPPLPQQTSGGINADSDPIGAMIQNDFKVPSPAPVNANNVEGSAPVPTPVSGIRVRDSAGGKIIGLLPTGSELVVSTTEKSDKPGWAKIARIRSGTPVAAVAGQSPSPHAPYGWVYVNELDIVVDPKPLDQVVILKTPFPVTAGTVIGYLGQYQDYTDSSSLPPGRTHPMLHLETFAGPDLEDFISRSRERVKQLPESKAFLEISPGARLVTNLPERDQTLTQTGLHLVPLGDTQGSCWIKVQPKTAAAASPATSNHPHPGSHPGHPHPQSPHLTNFGSPLWVDASLANQVTTGVVKGWKDFPLTVAGANGPGADFRDVFRRVDLDNLGAQNVAKDDKRVHWWNVTIGTKDGTTRQGWVCEKDHPLTRMCGPWDWPGFDLIDSSSIKPVDMFKRYLHVTQQLIDGEDKSEFEPSASLVNGGELITKLEKAIDTNHDGKITAQELKVAQQVPWLAEALSHLVVRCESEWGGGLGKWDDLSPLMKKLLWLWKAELERIGKLQWWEQVAGVGGFPNELNPWHFHPIGLIGNFVNSVDRGRILRLSDQDVDDLIKVTATEVALSLDDDNLGKQAGAVVDTILNRRMTGLQKWNTIRGVINERWQFSDINAPRPSAYGSVQNVPESRVSPRVRSLVVAHLQSRANGGASLVGNNLSYANPYALDEASEATRAWVEDVIHQASITGYRYGSGHAVHVHGTTQGLMSSRPDPYTIELPDSYSN
ncbi:lytic transglycosylase domain-containing protein [Paraburkholderia sp. D15]|uniref:lytic transglycosylase domain-containing protein n=1 Tax=Paraburkholderia sp. D15 TaxID=2880218 RepID=UPI00247836C7|nr:lytic transglycosylase domain-containing protein [Paraburkholderia sp. D15]WGS54620.1 lytic transglycosylase domain-containing protein [Paraburkholderia sp. D15]